MQFCWLFSGFITWLQPASLFLGAAGSKMTSLLCLGFVADCQLGISLSLTCSKVFHHSWARWTSYSYAGSIPRAQKWNLYFFLEPSEIYTISFYKSKRVLMPAWIQGLGEETLPVDWKNFNKCVIIFYFPHWASKIYIKPICQNPKFSFLKEVIIFYIYFHISSWECNHIVDSIICLLNRHWCLWMEKI